MGKILKLQAHKILHIIALIKETQQHDIQNLYGNKSDTNLILVQAVLKSLHSSQMHHANSKWFNACYGKITYFDAH